MKPRFTPGWMARGAVAAFTLIELLTVIAIIGVLAAIIIPVVGKVRNSASKATAITNFRQIGVAINLYAADNKDRLPGPSTDGAGWAFLNGQQALCGTVWPAYRTYLHSLSPTSIGTYLGVARETVDGVERFVCKQYLTPAFKGETGLEYPNDKIYVMGSTVDVKYSPFGSTAGRAMRLSQMQTVTQVTKRWMLREGIANTITKPIHGNGFVALYFDNHVGFISATDTGALSNSYY